MGRGDESVKAQLEADLGRVADAWYALGDLQEWGLQLARRRWRVADGEEFQECIHRIEAGLVVVHRWIQVLRRHASTLRVARLDSTDQEREPTKEDSSITDG